MGKTEIQQEPIVKIFDDFDGKPLPGDTRPERYQLEGKTYDLYLSKESKEAVQKFLTTLVSGAEEVKVPRQNRSHSGSQLSADEKSRRIAAYNSDNPDNQYSRYTAHVEKWWTRQEK